MATTDSNGLVLLEATDNLVPLQTTINGVTASISTALNNNVRTFKVANAAARDALATQRTPSKENPLQVWRQDTNIFEINYGSGWLSSSPEPNIMYINGSPYQRSGTISKNTPSSWIQRAPVWVLLETISTPYSPPAGWKFALNLEAPELWASVSVKSQTNSRMEYVIIAVKGASPGVTPIKLYWTLVND